MQDEIRAYLFDILQAAKDITEFTRDLTYADYVADAKTQAAVERKFEIIGESPESNQTHRQAASGDHPRP